MSNSAAKRVTVRGTVKTVLVVEDDISIANLLVTNLQLEGYHVVHAPSLTEGEAAYIEHKPALVLLDLNLPEGKGKGMDLCRMIRLEDTQLPIMMLTANVDEESAIKGLSVGASDYLRKPFGRRELLALVRNRLSPVLGKHRFGELVVDQDTQQTFYKEKEIALTPTEFTLLSLLIARPGDVISREQILSVIDEEANINNRTINSYISRIRNKLERSGATDIKITPCYGQGYRLEKVDGSK